MTEEALNNNANLIWSVAEILRGDLKQSEYQKVVLPLTVLRRLDAVLTPKKDEFLLKAEKVEGMEGAETALESIARTTYGHTFYNTSPLDFAKLTDDADNVAGNLRSYIAGFSPDVQDVFTRFNFDPIITRLASPRPACCNRWWGGSPRLICIRTRSTPMRWGICTRS